MRRSPRCRRFSSASRRRRLFVPGRFFRFRILQIIQFFVGQHALIPVGAETDNDHDLRSLRTYLRKKMCTRSSQKLRDGPFDPITIKVSVFLGRTSDDQMKRKNNGGFVVTNVEYRLKCVHARVIT